MAITPPAHCILSFLPQQPAWLDAQLREQLEQLKPRHLYEGLPIARFVLGVALRLAPVPLAARTLAEELLSGLQASRALPPYTPAWGGGAR
jgi:hypothetical protein